MSPTPGSCCATGTGTSHSNQMMSQNRGRSLSDARGSANMGRTGRVRSRSGMSGRRSVISSDGWNSFRSDFDRGSTYSRSPSPATQYSPHVGSRPSSPNSTANSTVFHSALRQPVVDTSLPTDAQHVRSQQPAVDCSLRKLVRRLSIPFVLMALAAAALLGFVITQVVIWKENEDVEEWLRYGSLGLSAGVMVLSIALSVMLLKHTTRGDGGV